ncbi:hypothetical protein VNO77_11394 [Canavalia gladiata]|uniref:Uncharacterized protein n=1 Tax=Canavalia gladiata TaxID=3824 RepID=A0AAN9MGS6_CANGL
MDYCTSEFSSPGPFSHKSRYSSTQKCYKMMDQVVHPSQVLTESTLVSGEANQNTAPRISWYLLKVGTLHRHAS